MRIIAGKFRGLKLLEFDYSNIRPTLDRAREGIFNKIQFVVPNSNCLDLFDGTGAVSLELVSRGAKSVITCDISQDSCDLIKKNFALAKIKPDLYKMDYLLALDKFQSQKFDIIFLDPPFVSDFGAKAILKIDELKILEKDGVLIFEHSSEQKIDDLIDLVSLKHLKMVDTKKYGYISVDYFVGV